MRGDHEAVRLAPELFIEDGSGDEEIAAARAARLDYLDEPVPVDTTAPKVLGPLTPSHPHALIATRNASFTLPRGGEMWFVIAGDLVDDRDERVVQAKKVGGRGLFRKPTAAEKAAQS